VCLKKEKLDVVCMAADDSADFRLKLRPLQILYVLSRP